MKVQPIRPIVRGCTLSRRSLWQYLGHAGVVAAAFAAASCSGGSYVSSSGTPAAAPTNVTGKSDTSGISAGSALQPPKSTATP
jgi:hypothetical protein